MKSYSPLNTEIDSFIFPKKVYFTTSFGIAKPIKYMYDSPL